MSDQKLRVGIIGIGLYTLLEHIPSFRATGRAEIVAASRRNPQLLELARRELSIPHAFTDWREMLEKIELDAVVIATPPNYHREPAVAALDRKLHLLVEKPLATTIEDADDILDAARQADRVVFIGVNRRGDPTWHAIRRALSTGAIGLVRQISAVVCVDARLFRDPMPIAQSILDFYESSPAMKAYMLDAVKPGNWRSDPIQVGGDFFADTGVHLVDAMLWMGGAAPVEVLAYRPRNRAPGASILTIQALLSNDVILSITFNDQIAMGDEFTFAGDGQIVILGDRGRITGSIGWGSGPAENLMIERNGDKQPLLVEGQTVTPAAAFIASILDGAPNNATVEDAARVVAFIQSAYRSADERRIVQFNQKDGS